VPQETASLQTIALPLSDEDQARADFYALIARLMLAPPNAGLLAALAAAEPIQPMASPRPDARSKTPG
jgi:hypothetical protein